MAVGRACGLTPAYEGGRYLVPEVPARLERSVQATFFSDVRWAKTTTFAE